MLLRRAKKAKYVILALIVALGNKQDLENQHIDGGSGLLVSETSHAIATDIDFELVREEGGLIAFHCIFRDLTVQFKSRSRMPIETNHYRRNRYRYN